MPLNTSKGQNDLYHRSISVKLKLEIASVVSMITDAVVQPTQQYKTIGSTLKTSKS